jgi:hypothetical protein
VLVFWRLRLASDAALPGPHADWSALAGLLAACMAPHPRPAACLTLSMLLCIFAVTALIAAFVSQFPQQPLEATAHALSYFG